MWNPVEGMLVFLSEGFPASGVFSQPFKNDSVERELSAFPASVWQDNELVALKAISLPTD